MKISVLTITARDHTGFESLVRSLQKAIPELQAEGCELELVWVHRNPGDKQALYTQAMSQIEGIDFTLEAKYGDVGGRQVLLSSGYNLKPKRLSDGYTKDGKKKYKRFFLIKEKL
mgnify:CR=1 FL=1